MSPAETAFAACWRLGRNSRSRADLEREASSAPTMRRSCYVHVVEMEWTALIRGNKILQIWASRGLFYIFVGALEWPNQLAGEEKHAQAFGIVVMEQIAAYCVTRHA